MNQHRLAARHARQMAQRIPCRDVNERNGGGLLRRQPFGPAHHAMCGRDHAAAEPFGDAGDHFVAGLDMLDQRPRAEDAARDLQAETVARQSAGNGVLGQQAPSHS